jgi:type IV pilus assembly protein PilY1
LCDIGGTSDLYGLFYRTGTPYFKAIFRDRVVNNRNVASVPLGKGQASTPSLLVDDKGNTHVLVGKDDGTLESVEAETPFNPRPHQIFWRER